MTRKCRSSASSAARPSASSTEGTPARCTRGTPSESGTYSARWTDPSRCEPCRRQPTGCIGEYATRHGGARTVSEAAARLGVDRKALSRVLAGRCRISLELALKLEAAGWGSAQSWTWQQASYDLEQARKRLNARTAGSRALHGTPLALEAT